MNPNIKYLAVIGSNSKMDRECVEQSLSEELKYDGKVIVIAGRDTENSLYAIVHDFCYDNKIEIDERLINWKTGNRAGARRNEQIAHDCTHAIVFKHGDCVISNKFMEHLDHDNLVVIEM